MFPSQHSLARFNVLVNASSTASRPRNDCHRQSSFSPAGFARCRRTGVILRQHRRCNATDTPSKQTDPTIVNATAIANLLVGGRRVLFVCGELTDEDPTPVLADDIKDARDTLLIERSAMLNAPSLSSYRADPLQALNNYFLRFWPRAFSSLVDRRELLLDEHTILGRICNTSPQGSVSVIDEGVLGLVRIAVDQECQAPVGRELVVDVNGSASEWRCSDFAGISPLDVQSFERGGCPYSSHETLQLDEIRLPSTFATNHTSLTPLNAFVETPLCHACGGESPLLPVVPVLGEKQLVSHQRFGLSSALTRASMSDALVFVGERHNRHVVSSLCRTALRRRATIYEIGVLDSRNGPLECGVESVVRVHLPPAVGLGAIERLANHGLAKERLRTTDSTLLSRRTSALDVVSAVTTYVTEQILPTHKFTLSVVAGVGALSWIVTKFA